MDMVLRWVSQIKTIPCCQMIIFESILTTFEASYIFWGTLDSNKNWLEPKFEPPLAILACQHWWNTRYFNIIQVFIKTCYFFSQWCCFQSNDNKFLFHFEHYFVQDAFFVTVCISTIILLYYSYLFFLINHPHLPFPIALLLHRFLKLPCFIIHDCKNIFWDIHPDIIFAEEVRYSWPLVMIEGCLHKPPPCCAISG